MKEALDLLGACASEHGFLAARDDAERYADYRRVWSRDGCVSGLAALLSGRDDLIACLRATLLTLRRYQGPSGQIASNVDPRSGRVSYGGAAGRVDATIWYVLTTCLYGKLSGDDDLVGESWPSLERAVAVLRAWEFNDGGLIYVPQGGDWADEYLLDGYLLYDQVLRVWALRELDAAGVRLGRSIHHGRHGLAELIGERYGATDERPFFSAGYTPGRDYPVFDAFGNALACLLQVGSEAERRSSCRYAASLSSSDLVPAFDPPIEADDPRYRQLERLSRSRELRNTAGRYHNGGLWPVVSGFWCLAARKIGEARAADRWERGLRATVALGFPEYLDAHTGESCGARQQAWSAAAVVMAESSTRLFS
jgi:glycogen debranching enzyme